MPDMGPTKELGLRPKFSFSLSFGGPTSFMLWFVLVRVGFFSYLILDFFCILCLLWSNFTPNI